MREPTKLRHENNKRFLFFREFSDSFEFLAQDGTTLRMRYKADHPPDWHATPLKGKDRQLRVFYAPAGKCEHRMRACQTEPHPDCDNACCSGAHCATYAAACAHHDLMDN